MGGYVLAAPVTRPENFKDGRLEGFDGLIDERCVFREKLLLLFDYGEITVEIAGISKRPAHLVALRNIIEQGTFFRFMAVNLQAEHAKTRIIQAAADNFEGSELLGNEKNGFASGESSGNKVRDSLRLAGSGWALDDQILTAKRVHECAVLRAVRIADEVRDVFLQLGLPAHRR